jgi:hypothetical protein
MIDLLENPSLAFYYFTILVHECIGRKEERKGGDPFSCWNLVHMSGFSIKSGMELDFKGVNLNEKKNHFTKM